MRLVQLPALGSGFVESGCTALDRARVRARKASPSNSIVCPEFLFDGVCDLFSAKFFDREKDAVIVDSEVN